MADYGTQQKSLSGLSCFRYFVVLDGNRSVLPSESNKDIKILELIVAPEMQTVAVKNDQEYQM